MSASLPLDAPTRPGRRERRWLRPRNVGLAVLGLLVAGLLGVWLVLDSMASRSLHIAEAEADRFDPGWRFADLLARRESVPASENGALALLDVLATMKGDFPRLKNPKAPWNYLRFQEELEKTEPGERMDDRLASSLRRDLRSRGEAVAKARAMVRYRRGRTDPNYGKFLYATLLPHAQNSRSAARLLQADAAIRAHDGDVTGALASCRAAIAVGRTIGDEPFMISQLVRIALVSVGITSAERALYQGEASDAELAALQALLMDELEHPAKLIGLRGERAVADDFFSKLATGELSYRDLNGTPAGEVASVVEVMTKTSGAFVRHNHALSLQAFNEAIEIARRPAHEQPALWERWDKERTPPKDDMVKAALSALSREVTPSDAYGRACLRIRASMQVMVLLLAAERQRLAHGAFPDRIEAIDPKFVPGELIDPFSGGPYHLISDGKGGLILYSVGFDGTDDGGQRLDLRKWMNKGADLGSRLLAPARRGRPPKEAKLPEDVFQRNSEEDEEIDAKAVP